MKRQLLIALEKFVFNNFMRISAVKRNLLSSSATEMEVEATIKSRLRFAFERSEATKKAKSTAESFLQAV